MSKRVPMLENTRLPLPKARVDLFPRILCACTSFAVLPANKTGHDAFRSTAVHISEPEVMPHTHC